MPDATITSTASTFGTISGVFSADQSTISGTISGIVPGTLTGSVGVPGPAGPAGIGLPAGGTSGQFLQKTSGVDYATDWVTVNLTGLATESWVTAGFYPLTGNPSSFLTASALTPYLTSATASTTYQTLAGMSDYLAKAGNLAGLANTGTARTNLGLGSLAVVNDAPSDGSQYARKNGAWDVVSVPASYITSVSSPLSVTTGNLSIDLSAYAQLSGATFTGNVFAPTPSPGTDSTRIATTEWVKDFDYAPTNSPHFTGNPKSVTPSTGDDDTSIATTAFVKAQGYITSSALSPYLTSADAASTYFTIASAAGKANLSGATFTNDIAVTISPDTTLIGAGVLGMSSTANSYSLTLSTVAGYPQIYFNGPTGTSTQTVAYPGPSGFLLKADNLSGLANTGTARTNLGLGTMATATAADYSTTTVANGLYYPLSSNPAGYLTSAPVTSVAGRTGAITLAVADVSGAAPLASPTFTGTPSLPTGTTAVTQTAGNNTTALATTAFVTAAVPAFATASQALALTSNTVSISPLTLQRVIMHPSFRRITSMAGNSVSTTSGTGSSNYVSSNWIENIGPSSGTTGSARVTPANVAGFDFIGRLSEANIDFSKRIILCGKFGQAAASGYLGDANNYWMFSLGKASAYSGDFTGRAIGIRKFGSTANFFLVVHDGTTLTAVDSGVGNNSYSATTDFTIVSDGAGNVTLFIDDNQVATTSAGPTGTATNGSRIYAEVNQVGTFGARIAAHTGNIGIYIAP
jgi:hypothetical protein